MLSVILVLGIGSRLGSIEIDGQIVTEGMMVGSASPTTIGVDGTATFGGNVTAATAPTAAEHLTNKTYVDAKAQSPMLMQSQDCRWWGLLRTSQYS